MPPGWNQIRSLLLAAAFTPAELEGLCQAVFGSSLSGITTATDANEQAEAIVAFAIQYGLLRELADLVLGQSARRPAVQNLLLSDDMQTDAQAATLANELQRVSIRLDRLFEQNAQTASTLAETQRWMANMDTWRQSIDTERHAEHARRAEPLTLADRVMVAMMTLLVAVIAMAGFYFFTVAK